MYPKTRMRRIRSNEKLRRLSQETILTANDLILPVFVISGENERQSIPLMPEIERISVDVLADTLEKTNLRTVLLFGIPEHNEKSEGATSVFDDNGIVPTVIRKLRKTHPDIAIITDVCLCSYTSHGHCGVIGNKGVVDNNATLKLLAKMALCHAAAGADMVAPSAMMDGQVAVIRDALDNQGFSDTAIMSYAAKFASSFYGPFRDAAKSVPAFGDRSSYQLPIGNRQEAVRDALLDESEGADWLMVKPALPYLDVLTELKQQTRLPVSAYQVSGEYSMIKHASKAGAFDEQKAVIETLTCFKRAGANAIITYYAKEVCKWLEK
jgi:porphobilinogen synthase